MHTSACIGTHPHRPRRQSGGGTDYLSDREICARLGIHGSTLWRMRRAGRFPASVAISPGRRATPRAAYEAYVASLTPPEAA